MTISSVSSDKSLTSNDGYEKGQQDTKKRADIQKEPDYTRSRINICICVGK